MAVTDPATHHSGNLAKSDVLLTGLFRPINYIGSKLRILESITDAINSVSRDSAPVCDLFSGSGTVSLALARNRKVVAVDIQEFSRVICSALLGQREISQGQINRILSETTERADILRAAMCPLVDCERSSISEAPGGTAHRLCNIVEQG